MDTLRVLQITTAAFGLLAVVLAFLLIDAYGEMDVLRQERSGTVTGGNGSQGGGASGNKSSDNQNGSNPAVDYSGTDAGSLKGQIASLQQALTAANSKATKLQQDRERLAKQVRDQGRELKDMQEKLRAGGSAHPPDEVPFKDPEVPMGGGAPPPSFQEMEALGQDLDLTQTELKIVYTEMQEGRAAFNRELARIQRDGGDFDDIKAIGQKISQRIQDRISRSLPPDKAEKFREYIEKTFAGEDAVVPE